MLEDMSDRMPEDMPDRMPNRMPDRMPEDLPEDMTEHMPEDMPDRMPNRMSEDMSDRMPEDLPEDMSEHMPEDMPDRMPNRMSEDMSDRMPEDMPDRMPEDLPVRTCINVMVGITRSKVIFCKFTRPGRSFGQSKSSKSSPFWDPNQPQSPPAPQRKTATPRAVAWHVAPPTYQSQRRPLSWGSRERISGPGGMAEVLSWNVDPKS